MRNIWLVTKHGVKTTLRKPSFWILAILMPVLLMAMLTYSEIQGNAPAASAGDQETSAEEEDTAAARIPLVGLVDEAGLIAEIPTEIPAGMFLSFSDSNAARAALEAHEIEQYVEIPPDYLTSGEVTVYAENFKIRSGGEEMGVAFRSDTQWMLRYLIDYNLTGDQELVTALRNPVPGALAKWHAVSPPAETDASSQALAKVVSRLTPYAYYFLLLMGGSYLMRSVVAERENRTVELLLLSVHPRELMAGKILAMSVAVLVQVVLWVGCGSLALNRGADFLNVSQYTFPAGFLVWAALFLVLGYLLSASVMAAAGALAPNAREGGQMMWLLIIPLMPTLMFAELFVEEPNNPLTLVCSLFPFSAPSAMVTRLAVGQVPLWQIIVSLTGLALTAYLFVVLAGRFFRAGNLLSLAPFSWRRLATGWRK